MHELEVLVRGQRYRGWTEARIHRALTAAAGSLSFTAAEQVGAPWPAQPGDHMAVYLDDELELAGAVVDEVAVSLTGEEHRLSWAARDLPGQLVDSSRLKVETWWDMELRPLVQELAQPFGVGVDYRVTEGLPRFATFATQPGETAWEAIERACRLRGVLATAGPDGRLVLLRPGGERAERVLFSKGGGPQSVLALQARYSHAERFNRYEVRGQEPMGDWLDATPPSTPRGVAVDHGIAGGRTRLILAEGIVTSQVAQDRALWEASVAAARGSAITVRLEGWRQHGSTGPLWAPGLLVPCQFPVVRLSGDLLIDEALLVYSAGDGWTSELRLVRPDAYLPQPQGLTAELDPADALENAEGGGF